MKTRNENEIRETMKATGHSRAMIVAHNIVRPAFPNVGHDATIQTDGNGNGYILPTPDSDNS